MSRIELSHVSYSYDPDHPEDETIKDISFAVDQGEFIGLIGQTGCGKSTLIQHMNGLLKATKGDIFYDGESIYAPKYNFQSLRFEVGLVFQYPEYQLFESTVLDDVSYGPKNQGLSKEEARESALEALKMVGVTKERTWKKSPFDISGGQKRRVAIAGVLAMHPKVLILDEPAAGLDPEGRELILEQIKKIHDETDLSVILVSHSMEDVANYVDRVLVMDHGRLVMDGKPRDIFSETEKMNKIGLFVPQVTFLAQELKKKGFPVSGETVLTVDEAVDAIEAGWKKKMN